MSYVVLARKWRPQNFADLVGQEHVSRTLANAIATDRVAHAFLFTGVRGVGKTSTARMLAKALNCEKGPTAEPCLTCDTCMQIGNGTDVDVQEIDGASYTGVEAVRSLQETIPYRPARDRFKIYIVDEVHMLSNAAWNAFLKTLEEPPPHVKFIFATTEVQKVPVTILSRCQRYDFKLIRTDAIAERLTYVLGEEKIEADDQAVRIVAREAAGSMRDAMSLLDQVIAWVGGTEEKLSAEGVARVLGVASRSVLHQLGSAVVDGDAATCLEVTAGLAQQGYPLANVARDFLEHLRMVVVAKVSPDPSQLLEVADEELADIRALAERANVDDLSRLYLGFSRAYDDIARSAQVRGAFEMALVRLAHRPPLVPLDELLQRLAELEQRLGKRGGGGGGGGGGGRRPAPREAEMRAASPPSVPAQMAPPAPPAPTPTGPAPAQASDPRAPTGMPRSAPPVVERRPPSRGPKPAFEPPPFPQRKPPSSQDSRPPSSGRAPRSQRPRPPTSPEALFGPPPKGLRTAAEAAEGESDASSERRPEDNICLPSERADVEPLPRKPAIPPAVLEAWESILSAVREKKAPIASVFEHAAPLEVASGRLVLGYPPGSFLLQQAQNADNQALLEAAATEHFSASTAIEIDTSARHQEVETLAERNAAIAREAERQARKKVEGHPLVLAAQELLGARLRDVRLPG